MDKSVPSKESLERAQKWVARKGFQWPESAIEWLALEFDAIRRERGEEIADLQRQLDIWEANEPCPECGENHVCGVQSHLRERDEVTEKLKRELEKAEGQLDIILRECQGDDDASLANDYGGTGWEKEVPVATVRWHRNKWKKSNEVAEKLAEFLEKLNGKIQTAGAERILATNFGELAIYFSGDEIRAMRKALAAYRERMGR